MNTIIENQGFVSTYRVNGSEIKHIRIYDKTGILFETSSGWFESEKNGRIVGFGLPASPKRKNKEDFNFVGSYVMKYPAKYNFDKGSVYLYIHASIVDFKAKGERVLFEMDTHNSFSNFAQVTIQAITNEPHKVKKSSENSFTGILWKKSNLHEITFEIHTLCHRSEDTNFGAKVKEMDIELNAKGIKIARYELEQLMKEYTLTANAKPSLLINTKTSSK